LYGLASGRPQIGQSMSNVSLMLMNNKKHTFWITSLQKSSYCRTGKEFYLIAENGSFHPY
jgi:hypothetical protein